MTRYYCKYCGVSTPTVATLTGGSCPRHPLGPGKGKHAPYEGTEKKQYVCKYCGQRASSIASLTGGSCRKNPNSNKRHEPMI